MKTNLLVIFLLFTVCIYPQLYVSEEGILKDSSYTVYGYYQKEVKKFPFIKIVYPEHKPNVKEELNIVYKTIGNRKIKLDLFYPDSVDRLLPIVIFVHGGGWRSGDKSFQHPLAIEVASKGYLCAAVEYRLSPEAKYPAAILDIKESIQWIKQNSDKYNCDSSKVTLVGCSSGGHLAAFCGVTSGIKKFEQTDSPFKATTKVNAVIDLDGILDFTHPAESGKDTIENNPSVGKLWLGETYRQNPTLWIEASPLTHFSDNSPEFFFINSSNDRFHAGRDEAINKLNKYGIYSEVYTFPDSPHTFWLFDPWFTQTVDEIAAFLKKNFK